MYTSIFAFTAKCASGKRYHERRVYMCIPWIAKDINTSLQNKSSENFMYKNHLTSS